MRKPIAISSGDPCGVGPEISVKAWEELKNELTFVLYTSFSFMESLFPNIPFIKINNPQEANKVMKMGLPIFDIPFSEKPIVGETNNKFAHETISSIKLAAASCLSGQSRALCTNPINKYNLRNNAGFKFSGHTDFLKHLTSSENVVMMLAPNKFKVIPATIHLSLSEAIKFLNKDLIKNTILTCHNSLINQFKISDPKIFVSGLNPHAGENGLFGREEINIISPVIEDLRRKGIDVNGPFSADSLFHKKMRECYDAVICMYHDQALIPIKTVSFDDAVNITLGLPFVRTSPDHGTAMDIAGKNLASAESLISAIRLANKLTSNNNEH